jgi:hypothetical protein
MPKNKLRPKTAIYHPPEKGMPYLVVTVSPDGVAVTVVNSKDEARILASTKTLKVALDDERAAQAVNEMDLPVGIAKVHGEA